jgi:hypothetical protein
MEVPSHWILEGTVMPLYRWEVNIQVTTPDPVVMGAQCIVYNKYLGGSRAYVGDFSATKLP